MRGNLKLLSIQLPNRSNVCVQVKPNVRDDITLGQTVLLLPFPGTPLIFAEFREKSVSYTLRFSYIHVCIYIPYTTLNWNPYLLSFSLEIYKNLSFYTTYRHIERS